MELPLLNHSSRTREWDSYGFDERSEIVNQWLFSSEKGHREIDRDILKLDPLYTKGFQSMGVLHFLGLKKDFKGIFKGMDLAAARRIMESDSQDFSSILDFLEGNIDVEVILQKKVSSKDKSFKRNFRTALETLTETDSLYKSAISRKEQASLRVHLFGNKKKIGCALCHKVLPVNLMIAAHIKPRKYCSHNERVDLNIVMPACKIGCDDLFEKGYLMVGKDGFIKKNPFHEYPSSLEEFMAQYDQKKCTFYKKETENYFEEKNRILNKDN